MTAKLPILCPSISDGIEYTSGPCTGKACTLWDTENNRCGEERNMTERYARHLDRDPLPPPCPKADTCRWHVQAVSLGETTCVIRRFGELCEHVGGTFSVDTVATPEEIDENIEGRKEE